MDDTDSGGSGKRAEVDTDDAEHAMSDALLTMASGTEIIEPGTRVDVCVRYDGSWSRGFEVVEVLDGAYRLRRLSDGSHLPGEFPAEDIRKARRRQGMWWY